MKKRYFITLVAVFCASYALAQTHGLHRDVEHERSHEGARHVVEAGDLRLIHGWAVAGADPLLVYLDIENHGDRTVTLVGAHGGWAGFDIVAPHLHEGTTSLVVLGRLPVPGHAKMSLAPGAVALRARDMTHTLAQGQVAHVTLQFDDGAQVDMDIEIQPPGTSRHPHAGHDHGDHDHGEHAGDGFVAQIVA